MKKLDQLFIRACKSKEPHTRLRSVYRRFYANNIKNPEKYIIQILLNICKTHCPIDPANIVTEFLRSCERCETFAFEPQEDYIVFYNILLSHIRLMEVKNLEGLTKPARFRG